MPEWTVARVEEGLRRAAARREGPSGCDTELAADARGIGGIAGIGVTTVVADGDDNAGAAAGALSWLRWLDPDDARIVVARLEGARWKLICWRFGISRQTADRRWRYALALMAWRLDGHAASSSNPSLRSMLKGSSGIKV